MTEPCCRVPAIFCNVADWSLWLNNESYIFASQLRDRSPTDMVCTFYHEGPLLMRMEWVAERLQCRMDIEVANVSAFEMNRDGGLVSGALIHDAPMFVNVASAERHPAVEYVRAESSQPLRGQFSVVFPPGMLRAHDELETVVAHFNRNAPGPSQRPVSASQAAHIGSGGSQHGNSRAASGQERAKQPREIPRNSSPMDVDKGRPSPTPVGGGTSGSSADVNTSTASSSQVPAPGDMFKSSLSTLIQLKQSWLGSQGNNTQPGEESSPHTSCLAQVRGWQKGSDALMQHTRDMILKVALRFRSESLTLPEVVGLVNDIENYTTRIDALLTEGQCALDNVVPDPEMDADSRQEIRTARKAAGNQARQFQLLVDNLRTQSLQLKKAHDVFFQSLMPLVPQNAADPRDTVDSGGSGRSQTRAERS